MDHKAVPTTTQRIVVCRECGGKITLVRASRNRTSHWSHVGNPDRWALEDRNQRRHMNSGGAGV